MDRLGSLLGANLSASLGSRLAAGSNQAYEDYRQPSARLPQLGQAVSTRSLALPMFGGANQLGRTTATRLGQGLGTYAMQLPDDGLSMFGRLASSAYGSGYDAIAQALGLNPTGAFGGSIGSLVGAPAQPTGPGFAAGRLDAASGELNAAAAKYGVPANFLKVIIAKESSGDWNRWAQTATHRGQPIMGYIGVYRDAATTRGLGDLWNRAHGNRGLQIELLAGVLRSQYDQLVKRYGPDKINWLNVASYHYSGKPFGGAAPADSVQHGSSDFYMNDTARLWRILEPGFNPSGAGGIAAAASSMGGSGWGGSDAIVTMLGGQSPRITQEIGMTDFARQNMGGMYAYSTGLGVPGHPGLDIGLNPGTPLYSPVAGTVIRDGGTGYYTDSRYNKYAPKRGELKIKLDNGDEVILGHMESIGVSVGQRVSAGMLVGRSGTNNGGHVHLEYRAYTPGATSSGYTAKDPRQVLGGGMGMGMGMMGQPAPDYSTFGSSIADAARLMWDAGLRNALLAQG